jgi:hypothetical protein
MIPYLLLCLGAFGPPALAGERATVARESAVVADPAMGAAVIQKLGPGIRVDVLERRGNWYKVHAIEVKGWVPFFALHLDPGAGPRRASFRGGRSRAAVMGVRGLEEAELVAARPDEAELARLERYRADPAALEGFGRYGSSRLVPVVAPPPLAPPSPAEEAAEREAGRGIAAALLGAAPLVEDERIEAYVNRVGAWLAARSERPGLPWRFGVLCSDSVNAFAVPGGYVFITLGLYQRLETEAELAGVLAHEIAHVTLRHHYRTLLAPKAMDSAKGGMARMVRKNPAVRAVVQGLAAKGCEIFTRALDRGAELEADQLGMLLAADAGYEPFGLARVLQLLAGDGPAAEGTALLFKTHPRPEDRLASLEAFAGMGRLSGLGLRPDLRRRFEKHSLRKVRTRRE